MCLLVLWRGVFVCLLLFWRGAFVCPKPLWRGEFVCVLLLWRGELVCVLLLWKGEFVCVPSTAAAAIVPTAFSLPQHPHSCPRHLALHFHLTATAGVFISAAPVLLFHLTATAGAFISAAPGFTFPPLLPGSHEGFCSPSVHLPPFGCLFRDWNSLSNPPLH